MNSILALFGTTDTKASLSEVVLENLELIDDNYGIEVDDDIVIKQNTTSKTRYLLNNQTISKKNLKQFAKRFTKHLHLKDITDFDNHNIISFLDFLSCKNDTKFNNILEQFNLKYDEYIDLEKKLTKIINDEKELEDLVDFTKFEIEKIDKIDPKIDEYEELKSLKSTLSKKDKIEEILQEVQPFLNNTHKISTALDILEVDSEFFDDTINEINSHFEKFYDNLANMEDMDIENILNRIEDLAFLNKKFGGIKEALEYKELKQKELEGYENISFEKAILEKNVSILSKEIDSLAYTISQKRAKTLTIFEHKINQYLQYLYLENLSIHINTKPLDRLGIDMVEFKLNKISLNKISSGEFNRLRLALLTARSFYEIDTNGILFLDEIDANLSGKESQSIAKVLEELSQHYQIFTISHQPQLSAIANQHYLVKKQNNISSVKLLDKNQRVQEIARMISGENITQEAIEFAKNLI
jgi:DNA repair protein RecN (Recombination protein N)